jgi:predicted TIM-barrel fold metal-dependent hydrolase
MRAAPLGIAEIRAKLGSDWPPAGLVDAHAHAIEPGHPLATTREYDPEPFPIEAYRRHAAALGVTRSVMVTASCYGFDNSVTRNALAELGPQARGVAMIDPEIQEAELGKYVDAGFVGARILTARPGVVGDGAFETVAQRCVAHGWHVEINVRDAYEWLALEPRLRQSPVPLAFEHIGRAGGDEGTEAEGFRAMLRLLEARPDFHVKVTGDFGGREPALRVLASRFPRQLVWGSNLPETPLEELLPLWQWMSEPALRQAVFADNAARLYRF